VNLGQAVSFFFVLSGFILAYVYPKLDTWQKVVRFWRARIARIWPAYFATFLLYLLLNPGRWDSEVTVANLLMVQAWIPLSAYYSAYNPVAWSISTEYFFYLAFPAILYNFDKSWLLKLIGAGVGLIALIAFINHLALPGFGHPNIGLNGQLVTQHGLIYISPLSRIFEFVFGMCVAHIWRNSGDMKRAPIMATGFEMGAISLCAMSMYYMSFLAAWGCKSILGAPFGLWLEHSGSVFTFGLLIFVMARGNGAISRLLAHPFLVLLGEISLSIYLIHKFLLNIYSVKIAGVTHLSNPIAYGAFIIVLLLSSYLMWTCIEMPGRRLIMGHRNMHGTTVMKKSWHDHFTLSRKTLLAGLALCLMIAMVYVSM
jgi:peptidoglycan/LPS O-acetylase OafA/YrhL